MKEFDKVIGYKSIKKELEFICDIMRNPDKYKKLGVDCPGGVILYGEPGLGKTLMAKCFVEACGRKTFTLRKDKPDGEFINEIRSTFEKAIELSEKEPVILFFDDIDKIENEDEMHRNGEGFVTIQSCIDNAKGKDIFIFATANNIHSMPYSLLRAGRFDKKIEVNSPNHKDAIEIVKYYLSKKKHVSDIDPEEIARILDGRSCAVLETVINEAGIYAGFENREFIEKSDIVKASMRIIYDAPIEEEEEDNPFLMNIAYHECGHAVIEEVVEPGTVNLVTVCGNTGKKGGFTSYYQDEHYFYSKEYMENRVISILGGRAATEIVYGTTDVGANSDLHRAFDIVSRFVDDYCGFGFNYWEGQCAASSPELLNRKEQLIYSEMERYYQKAKKILLENRSTLDRMAKELYEKKILTSSDVKKIMETT